MFEIVKNFIGGQFEVGRLNNTYAVHSPINGRQLATFSGSMVADLENIIFGATKAQKLWQKITLKERVQVFYAPPLTITKSEIDQGLEIISKALTIADLAIYEQRKLNINSNSQISHVSKLTN